MRIWILFEQLWRSWAQPDVLAIQHAERWSVLFDRWPHGPYKPTTSMISEKLTLSCLSVHKSSSHFWQEPPFSVWENRFKVVIRVAIHAFTSKNLCCIALMGRNDLQKILSQELSAPVTSSSWGRYKDVAKVNLPKSLKCEVFTLGTNMVSSWMSSQRSLGGLRNTSLWQPCWRHRVCGNKTAT